MKLLKINVENFYRTSKLLCNLISIEKIDTTKCIYTGNFIRKCLLESSK